MKPTSQSTDGRTRDMHGYEERLRFETLLTDLSARFVNVQVERLDAEIGEALSKICECLDIDLGAFWEWEDDGGQTAVLTHLYRPLGGAPVPRRMAGGEYFPWLVGQMAEKRTIVHSSLRDLPRDADLDRASLQHYGVKSHLGFPLSAGGGKTFGVLSLCSVRAERQWDEVIVSRVGLLTQIFANALSRRLTDSALRRSEARLSLAADSAGVGLWSLNLQNRHVWVTAKTRELFGFSEDETVTLDRFMALVVPADRETVQEALDLVVSSGDEGQVEYRIQTKAGNERWIASRGRLQACAPGEATTAVMGVSVDVTANKEAEQALHRALREVEELRDKLHNENVYLRERIHAEAAHQSIAGESQAVRAMLALAGKVAPTDAVVLIVGETGTGKELLAQAIHDLSTRRNRPMVKVNCAALPAPLVESELFGREKGAYTGALTQQAGRFEVANGSTIFLDEIGDLPLDLQAKLLRVLQDGEYERLGSHRTLRTDVRVIAATNRDLPAMVRERTFREDLYHRLNVFPIQTPPLRARLEDIPLLVWKFVLEFNDKMGRAIDAIPRATMERLRQYSWPGNVRELRNLIERSMIVSDGRTLSIHLPDEHTSTATALLALEDMERQHILKVLEHTYWRISGPHGAAEILRLPPSTLRSRMGKLGIRRPRP